MECSRGALLSAFGMLLGHSLIGLPRLGDRSLPAGQRAKSGEKLAGNQCRLPLGTLSSLHGEDGIDAFFADL